VHGAAAQRIAYAVFRRGERQEQLDTEVTDLAKGPRILRYSPAGDRKILGPFEWSPV
jgi:hypothetical protein